MQRSLLLLPFVLFLVAGSAYAQPEDATTAPAQDLFSLEGDQIGLFQNSVNLFTGEVAFALPLAGIPGRGGLTASVAISYNSSGVREKARVSNQESPTGILGLGWQLDVPKIVVDNKQTGTKVDDEYYLVEGGASSRLVWLRSSGGTYFKPQVDDFSTVQYIEEAEKWIITKIDGTKYTYGGKDTGRNTVQYLIQWANWIGNSRRVSNQERLAKQWDLSSIRNHWGDSVTFAYDLVEKRFNSSSLKHTEASYLTTITNPQGQSITLHYEEKISNRDNREYIEPHTAVDESKAYDAYQEVYETRALKRISVQDEAQNERYRIEFDYLTMWQGDLTKRLLSGIQKFVNNQPVSAPIEFDYHLAWQGDTAPLAGLLRLITTSQGPQLTYTHTSTTIENSERELTISAPAGFAEPQTWIGQDYVVVAWRALDGIDHAEYARDVQLSVYTWDGKWYEQFRQGISGVLLQGNHYKNFSVALGEDFFAVMHTSESVTTNTLLLSYRDPKRPGQWIFENRSYAADPKPAVLLSGEKFVAVANQTDGVIHALTWDGSDWQEQQIDNLTGDYFYGSGPSYIIWNDNDSPGNDVIAINYLDEQLQWQEKNVPNTLTFNSGDDPGGRSYWYGGSTFAVVMADENHEFIYHWDEDFNFSRTDIGGWYDPSSVRINNSSVLINHAGEAQAWRYDGLTWNASPKFNYRNGYPNQISMGEDYIVYNSGIVEDGFYQIAQLKFDPTTAAWQPPAMRVTASNTIYQDVHAGIDYFMVEGELYHRNSNEEWDFFNAINPTPESFRWASGGHRLFAVQEGSQTTVYQVRDKSIENQYEVDGSIARSYFYTGNKKSTHAYTIANLLIGSNIITTYQGAAHMTDATSLTFYKLVGGELQGKQTAFPVTLMTVSDGYHRYHTSYVYTETTALMTSQGASAQFNETMVVPGSYNPAGKPHGFFKHYFINGLPSHELTLPLTSTGMAGNIGRLIGIPYAVKSYNQQGDLVAESTTRWQVFEKDIKTIPDDIQVAIGYFARPTESIQSQDGMTQKVTSVYDDTKNGLPSAKIATDSQGKIRKTNYLYSGDQGAIGGTSLSIRGIINTVIEQTVEVDGQVVEKSNSNYTLNPNLLSSMTTKVYPTGGTQSIETNYQYDRYGNVVEKITEGGLTTAYLYGYQHTLPVAEATGTTYNVLRGKVDLGLQTMNDDDLRQELHTVRSELPDAFVTSYTYDWLYGPTSETDPRGRTTYTHYDGQGRLHYVTDNELNVRQKLKYSSWEQ